MRAFAVRSFGEPASVQDLPVPAVDGALLVRVRFAGSTRWTATSWDA
jgi:hypothetical protein